MRSAATAIFDPAGRASQQIINQVKVMMTEDMHDTAIITLRGASASAPELQPGTPVQMQYGWLGADMDWFYGYIDHIEHHYDRTISDLSTLEDVVCLGASYSLKDPYIGGWTDVQASSLVALVAKKYYLSSVVETDDTIWPQLAAPGESAWCFLTDLATRTGYTLACNKTTIRFTSINVAVARYWQTMPVFNARKAANTYAQQGVSQFQSLTGEALGLNGHTKAIRSVNGIDLQTGQIIAAVNTSADPAPLGQKVNYPFFHQQVSDNVVTTQGHAKSVLEGMFQDNRFPYQATAILTGMTAVRQGVPIVLSGLDSNNDGMWWVQEVVHTINHASYSLHVSLGRDATGDNGLRPIQGTAVTYSATNPFAYTIANAPPTKLVNQRWRSSHASNVGIS
jgi:phage protein D